MISMVLSLALPSMLPPCSPPEPLLQNQLPLPALLSVQPSGASGSA